MLLGACASTSLDPVRFRNQAPVSVVNDRQPIPKPNRPSFALLLYHLDNFLFRRLTRVMEVPVPSRARNVNSLDEVPDSSWFVNRIGVRELSLDELRRGPNRDAGPDTSAPWHVLGTKVGGKSPGLLIKDARGQKFLLKFDKPEAPDTETGADVVGQRLLWALGYYTPEDSIVFFTRAQLALSPQAVVKDFFDNERPMRPRDLDEVLSRVDQRPDGSYRGLASRFLSGALLGGYWPEGVREDDPNDRIPHEDRRDVRGQYVFFAWLGHTDIKPDNTLDVWVEDPTDASRHHVQHYLIDFGQALGVTGVVERVAADGYSHAAFDFQYAPLSMISLGLWKRPWEGAAAPPLRGVGRFESEHFDPGAWKAQYPFIPWARMDDFDGFWAAKLVMRFSPQQIRAAVEAGRFDDARAVDYLTRVLVERQRKTGAYWFARVNPLDGFQLVGGDLCFQDLWLSYGLGQAAGTRYRAQAYDFEGRAIGWQASADGAARTCFRGLSPTRDHEGYLIVSIETERDRRRLPPVLVHMAIDPTTRALRVIGLRRQ